MPPLARSRDKGLASWLNDLRKAVESVAKSVPQAATGRSGHGLSKVGSYLHPFKIVMDGLDLYVYQGRITTYALNGSFLPYPTEIPVEYSPGHTDLLGDTYPATNGSPGFTTLSAGGTYGVWVVCDQYEYTTSPPSFVDDYYAVVAYAPQIPASAQVYVSSNVNEIEYTNSSDVVTAFAGTLSNPAAFFIGKVEVDGDGGVTVKQWRKSDIFAQMTVFPDEFIYIRQTQ
jgi:hypothetical protein